MIKQSDIIFGYKKLEEIKNIKLPASVSLSVFLFKKKIKEFYDWQIEEEKRIFDEYSATITNDGNVTLADMSKAQAFTDEINELGDLPHEDVDKISVPISAFDTLSLEDVETLSKIFDFT